MASALDEPGLAEAPATVTLQQLDQDDQDEWEYEYSTTETEVRSICKSAAMNVADPVSNLGP